MAGYDGTIRINTSLDSKGFVKGVKGIQGAVGGLVKSFGPLLGIAAIGGFIGLIKQSIDESNRYQAAMLGLQSIVEGTGKSFSDAKNYLDEYTKDGLIPMSDAATAYKNLAARGYDTGQIETSMNRLKDAAAFGRQGTLSMGEAVRSATEGLKNENSVLVDNAGVTKNVSVMWKEYAESIGKGVQSLTQADKIQAEVSGIMRETQHQVGNAATLTTTYAGKVAALGKAFTELKQAIGDSITPILSRLIPAITAAVNWLRGLFTQVAGFMAALFGTTIAASGPAIGGQEALAGALEGTAAAAEAAGKAAKGALAPFDELNVLSQNEPSGGGGEGEVAPIPTPEPETPDETVIDKFKGIAEKIREFFEPLKEAFGRLGEAFGNLGQAAKDALGPLFKDTDIGTFITLVRDGLIVVINALAWAVNWLAEQIEKHPEAFRTLALVVGALALAFVILSSPVAAVTALVVILLGIIGLLAQNWGTITETIKTLWTAFVTWLYDKVQAIKGFFSNLVEKAKEGWIEIVTKAKERIDRLKQDFNDGIEKIKGFFSGLKEKIIEAWTKIKEKAVEVWDGIKTKVDTVVGNIKQFFDDLKTKAETVWDKVKEFGETAWTKIKTAWDTALTWFETTIITPIKTAFSTAWDTISSKVTGVWDAVKLAWQGALTWFNNTIIDPITGAFETAWETIKSSVITAFDGVSTAVKSAINGVIGFINGMISGVVSGVNAIINALNSINITIPDWIPLLGGHSIGFNLQPINAPQIPLLASGAVIPPNAQFLAMLGDQKSGRNLEAPEDLIRQIVREETARAPGQEVTINFAGNMGSLIRVLKPYIDKENKRTGTSLVAGRGRA